MEPHMTVAVVTLAVLALAEFVAIIWLLLVIAYLDREYVNVRHKLKRLI
jgi:hypothetical protein